MGWKRRRLLARDMRSVHDRRDNVGIGLPAWVDALEEGVIVLDHQLRYLYVNTCAASLLNLSASRVIGQPYADGASCLPPCFVQGWADTSRHHTPTCFAWYYPEVQRWIAHRIVPSAACVFVFLSEQQPHPIPALPTPRLPEIGIALFTDTDACVLAANDAFFTLTGYCRDTLAAGCAERRVCTPLQHQAVSLADFIMDGRCDMGIFHTSSPPSKQLTIVRERTAPTTEQISIVMVVDCGMPQTPGRARELPADLFAVSPTATLVMLASGTLLANAALISLFGYPTPLTADLVQDLPLTADDQTLIHSILHNALHAGVPFPQHLGRYHHASGRGIWLAFAVAIVRSTEGVPQYVVATATEVTDHYCLATAFQQSEERFSLIFTHAPGAALLTHNATQRIVEANRACERLLGYGQGEMIGKTSLELDCYVDNAVRMRNASIFREQGFVQNQHVQLRTTTGDIRDCLLSATGIEMHGQSYILTTLQDITDHEGARAQIRHQAALIDHVSDAIIATDVAFRITSWNKAAETIYGWAAADVLGAPVQTIIPPDYLHDTAEHALAHFRATGSWSGTVAQPQKDGTVRHIASAVSMMYDDRGTPLGVVAVNRDITDRKRVEQELHESEERYRQLLEAAPLGIAVHCDGRIVFTNAAGARLLGAQSPDQLVGRPIAAIIHPHGLVAAQARIQHMLAGATDLYPVEDTYIRLDGSLVHVEVVATALQYNGAPAVQVVITDITARKQAEQTVQLQLARLQSLHTIDQVMTSGLDVRVTLNVLLEQVTTQLDVDAAAVLLLDASTQTLHFAAANGFHSRAIQHTQLRLGEGYAGRAARERRTIYIPQILEVGGDLARALVLQRESFTAYYGVPLVTKGVVKGVLELFHRGPLQPTPEWMDFLDMLAGQAAIAIDDAQLFERLQRSNAELALAYDETIEGWSRAMDLRDKETEGHTQRVTQLTVTLARAAGMSDADIVHVRRGALLHDMGKLGVPDAILLKEGTLTGEERAIMQRHPEYAYTMLASIQYLAPALDIPYCHHEKWDGTGYPRGLKGATIPLAARLFAVVDVWDALCSDRPYRAGWPHERVVAYIQSQVGAHFDPAAVALFLNVVVH